MDAKTSRLQIVKYPAPILRKKAATVERVTPDIARFIDDMIETMYDGNGAGLAAPQVGISLRIVVIDVGDGPFALINPVITAREGEQTGIEGCLSLPNLHGDTPRAKRVTVRGLNKHGKKITLSGNDMWARAVQHEVDHLDGILFIDRVTQDTLYWVTGEQDADGNYLERPTSLEDALRIFERDAVAVR